MPGASIGLALTEKIPGKAKPPPQYHVERNGAQAIETHRALPPVLIGKALQTSFNNGHPQKQHHQASCTSANAILFLLLSHPETVKPVLAIAIDPAQYYSLFY